MAEDSAGVVVNSRTEKQREKGESTAEGCPSLKRIRVNMNCRSIPVEASHILSKLVCNVAGCLKCLFSNVK